MAISRHFHGWKEPALTAAVNYLCHKWKKQGAQGPLDLRSTLLVVPTRHAGRRLRAALAQTANHHHTAVLSGPVVTPNHLITLPPNAASDTTALALIARCLLRQRRAGALQALFPAPEPEWDLPFALGLAAQLQELRRELTDADSSITRIAPFIPAEEKERWADLCQLENAILEEFRSLGLQDPCQARREAARTPPPPNTPSCIHLLFIPDLAPLVQRRLESLASSSQVEIHILAPESEAERFDEWGRPRPEAWEDEVLPLTESQIHVFEQTPDETAALANLLQEADHFNRALALCMPDSENAQALARHLATTRFSLYLPNGLPLGHTAIGRLVLSWLDFLQKRSYAATAAFLRQPAAQDWLEQKLDNVSRTQILIELDRCHTKHLPVSSDDLLKAADPEKYPHLAGALQLLAARRLSPLPDFFAEVLAASTPSQPSPPDAFDTEAAQALAQLLSETADTTQGLSLSPEDSQAILSAALFEKIVFPQPNLTGRREAVGWLEIQWETAPAVILADLREGIVPELRIGDAFLPDFIRTQAGIPGNRESLARDLFLARALLESRPPGAVRCLFSRRAASQEPQRPSRLLLACPNDLLPSRVQLLFERPASSHSHAPPALPNLRLAPPSPANLPLPSSLTVSDFRCYLSCPFRFYLARILGMETVDDGQQELEATEFGTLAHEVLRILHLHPDWDDERRLARLLLRELFRIAHRRFGRHPPLAVRFQLDSLQQRLLAAVRVHCQTVADGWQILAVEQRLEAELATPDNSGRLFVRGRLDRIERHRQTGAIRILDYKTADSVSPPAKEHYQSRNQRWVDLQLPLYRFLYQSKFRAPKVSVGYFHLPKTVHDTQIQEFSEMGEASSELFQSAIATAREVVANILARRFWPPASLPDRKDDFSSLFCAGIECLEPWPGAPPP